MKAALQSKLRKEFPFLLPPPKKGRSMIVPMDYGLAIGDGWYQLFRQLCIDIVKELEKEPALRQHFTVLQVKEKFGTLRVYILGGNEAIRDATDLAAGKSAEVCERCGRSGKLENVEGWYKTLCKGCYRNVMNERKLMRAESVAESLGATGKAQKRLGRRIFKDNADRLTTVK